MPHSAVGRLKPADILSLGVSSSEFTPKKHLPRLGRLTAIRTAHVWSNTQESPPGAYARMAIGRMKTEFGMHTFSSLRSFLLPLATCLFFCLYIIAVWHLAPANPTTPDADTAGLFLDFYQDDLHAEPKDHFIYLATSIGVVIFALLAALAAPRCEKRRYPVAIWASLFLTFVLFTIINRNLLSLLTEVFTTLYSYILSSLLLIIFVLSRKNTILSFSILVLSLLIFGAYTIFFRIWHVDEITYAAHFFSHHEAVIYSLIQISSGRTCLVDVQPQYGCYGELIAPVLWIFGTSTFAITSLFGAIFLVAIAFIIDAARRIIPHPAVLAATAVWLLFLASMILFFGSPDPYYAYYPIRVLFPAIAFWLFVRVDAEPLSHRSACGLGLFCALAIFWNLDSGAAVTLGMAAMIFLGGFSDGRWRHPMDRLKTRLPLTLMFVTAVGVGLLLAVACLWLKSGAEPTIANFFRYQQLFALSGFAMIPLSSPTGYWVLLLVIFLLVLLVSASAALYGAKRDRPLEAAAILAFMGLGLMLYFFGRSHFFVLRLVAWPGCILAFFLASRALDTASRPTRALVAASVCIAAAVPFSFAVQNVVQPKFIFGEMHRRDSPDTIMGDVEMIRRFTSPGERIVIFGLNSGTLYGATGTIPALPGLSYPERLLRSDLKNERENIIEHGPKKIFVQFGDEEDFGETLIKLDKIEEKYNTRFYSENLHYRYLVRKDSSN